MHWQFIIRYCRWRFHIKSVTGPYTCEGVYLWFVDCHIFSCTVIMITRHIRSYCEYFDPFNTTYCILTCDIVPFLLWYQWIRIWCRISIQLFVPKMPIMVISPLPLTIKEAYRELCGRTGQPWLCRLWSPCIVTAALRLQVIANAQGVCQFLRTVSSACAAVETGKCTDEG